MITMVNKLECTVQTVNATTKIENCQFILDSYEPLYILALIVVAVPFIVFLYFRLTAKIIEKYNEAGGVKWDEEQ